jgi:hypothetical protein
MTRSPIAIRFAATSPSPLALVVLLVGSALGFYFGGKPTGK